MKKIFLFWLSLALTSFAMSLESPICTSVISSLENSKINLAAFGVTFAFSLFLQSPVSRIMSLPLMFIEDRQSYLKVRQFAFILSTSISLLFLLAVTEPVFNNIIIPLLGLSPELSGLVKGGLLSWIPIPILMGLRRFYQGVLLCAHEPRKISIATFSRLVTLIVIIHLLRQVGGFSGVQLGVLSIQVGMFFELVLSWIFARPQVAEFLSKERVGNSTDLSLKGIVKVFFPLAVSTVVAMSNGAILAAFTARGQLPIESLALLPIIFGLLNPFAWSSFAIQDSTHALIAKTKEIYPLVKKFSYIMGLALSLMLLLVGLTPLSDYYLLEINHLSDNMFALTPFPVLFIPIIPFTMAMKNFYRGAIIAEGRTKLLMISESFEIFLLITIFLFLIYTFSAPAINLAMISLWLASFINLGMLWWWERGRV